MRRELAERERLAQPARPTITSWRSRPCLRRSRKASSSTGRFLRGSSVPTARTYGARGPSGACASKNFGSTPFGVTWMRSAATPVAATRSAFAAFETVNTAAARASACGYSGR